MMSPPAKTASRYIHVACTSSHKAMFSLTSVSFAIHPCTSSRNGATYLLGNTTMNDLEGGRKRAQR